MRRQNSSAIAASFTAHAAFSARVTPAIASTNAASLSDVKSSIPGSEPSNIYSNLVTVSDANHRLDASLWMNS